MAENTEISWTDHTFNPWSGCTKVSPACDICYAEVNYSVKMRGVKWGKYGNRIIASDSMWKQPLAWNRKAEAEGVRKRVFCASLADVFEGDESMPAEALHPVENARGRLFELIDATPHLDWLLLTKRPENVLKMLHRHGRYGTLSKLMPNVWVGTTVENQKYANIRIPELLKIPAAVRFLSVEPMLGPVDLTNISTMKFRGAEAVNALTGELKDVCGVQVDATWSLINWVICGGESGGQKARPMHPDWVRSLRDQCVAAGVPFHFKQWGANWPHEQGKYASDAETHVDPDAADSEFYRIGKKNSGRMLDGREWLEFPEVRA